MKIMMTMTYLVGPSFLPVCPNFSQSGKAYCLIYGIMNFK